MKLPSAIQRPINQVRNFWGFNTPDYNKSSPDIISTPQQARSNLNRIIAPVQFERLRHDIKMWRDAIVEAEQGFSQMRFRVKMQRMYIDTILNEHVMACIKTRKRLTLLKEFAIVDENEKVDIEATKIFNSDWFKRFLGYVIDANFYGYSLIALNDIINDSFPNLSFIRREHVSPDRLNVSSLVYGINGYSFMEDPFKDWHIWVPTPSDTMASPCGYGLFYSIAKTEIFLRNSTSYNVDWMELYGQPIRHGKTSKQDDERDEFFQALLDMAHNATIVTDPMDELNLVNDKGAGTGWQGFKDFEERAEAKITKIILGHADAMSSVPGKLGASQKEGEKSPVQKALDAVETEDGELCENVVNNELIPRMLKLGFNLPVGKTFKFLNNKEKQEIRKSEDQSNQITAEIAYNLKQAGLQMDPEYFTERTGIPVTSVGPTVPLTPQMKARLNQIYGRIQ